MSNILDHLEEFPRQYAALEAAMARFGDEFDLQEFKQAYESAEDMASYNDVQAVERAVGRVQNFLTDLALDGARLAELPLKPPTDDDSKVRPSFVALREAGVIDAALCRMLERGQRARSRLEHEYLGMPAGDVHRTALLVRDTARDFIGPYRAWIEKHL